MPAFFVQFNSVRVVVHDETAKDAIIRAEKEYSEVAQGVEPAAAVHSAIAYTCKIEGCRNTDLGHHTRLCKAHR